MAHRGHVTTIWMAILVALAFGWAAPAAAQETAEESRQALNSVDTQMQALTREIENFRINSRYCKPPAIPTKAEAQAALDEIAARVGSANRRYSTLKQGLKDLARTSRIAAEMMIRDVDPSDERWWIQHERLRQRMNDALARKRAALAAAPEINCSPPKPKPTPVVTTGGFQPPPLPQRPATGVLNWPALPDHFCSWDDYAKFLREQVDPLYLRAAEDAERAAHFRAEVERAVNSYVQNDRPVPPELIARRRQAIADVAEADRKMRESEDFRRRAKAIPVIDCRKPANTEPARADPPRTEPPRTEPGPKFQTGSLFDDMRNQIYATVNEMQAAYDRCDVATYERLLADLERLYEQARLARGAATGSGEFSRIDAKEADGLVQALRSLLEPRRWGLLDLKRRCREKARTQPPSAPTQTGFVPPPDRAMATILEEHNKARAEAGSPPLRWDPQLAAQAASYAPTITPDGRPVHSSRTGRETTRENLLPVLPGTSPRNMVGVWTAERKNFVPGTFPNVSKTGNWADVGHYTQMIWPTTTNVGCAIHKGQPYDWLVCRYSPPGNRDGSPILADNSGIAPPNSSTPTYPPHLPDKAGGGMQRIDPPPPPAPPAPTARDEAPGGNEDHHPLVVYGAEAFIRHSAAVDCGDDVTARNELSKLHYAIEQLRERLQAARRAGKFSAVKPEDVQRQIDLLESFLRAAERRRPGGACPLPPSPPPPPRRAGTERG
jgi:hypothetical protein